MRTSEILLSLHSKSVYFDYFFNFLGKFRVSLFIFHLSELRIVYFLDFPENFRAFSFQFSLISFDNFCLLNSPPFKIITKQFAQIPRFRFEFLLSTSFCLSFRQSHNFPAKMARNAHRLDDTNKIRTLDVTESTTKRTFSDLNLNPK